MDRDMIYSFRISRISPDQKKTILVRQVAIQFHANWLEYFYHQRASQLFLYWDANISLLIYLISLINISLNWPFVNVYYNKQANIRNVQNMFNIKTTTKNPIKLYCINTMCFICHISKYSIYTIHRIHYIYHVWYRYYTYCL